MPRRPAGYLGGGQGVRSDPESEGLRKVSGCNRLGGTPDEQVGQRWGKVEPALWGEALLIHPIVPGVADGTIRKIHA